MQFGYARCSQPENDGANLETQIGILREYGIHPHSIYAEIASGGTFARPQWKALAAAVQPDDVIVVTHLDRLSRNVVQGLEAIRELSHRGVGIHSISDGINTSRMAPAGVMHMTIMLAVAEWVRETAIQRSREGVARARAQGRHPGRKPVLTPAQEALVAQEHWHAGKSIATLAADWQCSRTPILRAIRKHPRR